MIMKLFFPVLTILSCLTFQLKGQEKHKSYDVEIGVSVPELYHAGLGYNYNDRGKIEFKLGVDFGTFDDETLKALTLNHSWYFGKLNSMVNKATWSLNTGGTMMVEKYEEESSYVFYLNLYVCKDLPISRKFFVRPELGASYFLCEKSAPNVEFNEGYRIRLIPKFGLSLFYKI